MGANQAARGERGAPGELGLVRLGGVHEPGPAEARTDRVEGGGDGLVGLPGGRLG